MDQQHAGGLLSKIREEYRTIPSPKYRYADLDDLEQKLELLKRIKHSVQQDKTYRDLMNALSQIVARQKKKSTWRTTSERGINKAIPPVLKKGRREMAFPFEWIDESSRHRCSINNGYWGARNYMLMDVLGYFFLLKEGGDSLPKDPSPIFKDLDSIRRREDELHQESETYALTKTHLPIADNNVDAIRHSQHWLRFDDKEFRKFTSLTLSSNEILKLILETSRVEFKLAFRVRLREAERRPKERIYLMNIFSRLFEFGYVDKAVRSDGVVRSREYYVSFNTILGEIFVHNLKTKNYDWLENDFYNLPSLAQVFYRKFLIHHNFPHLQLNLETIAAKLNLQDTNITNLTATIEESALKPLNDYGLILSHKKKEQGLYGMKYIITRAQKENEDCNTKT